MLTERDPYLSAQNCRSPEEAERAVIEEFGKCIQQIIAAAGTGRVTRP